MKTPKSKKKKNKKAKETLKDVDTIDLTSSPAPSSAPASSPAARPDAYSVPNSPAKSAADKAAMPPPTSRPGEKSASQPPAPRDPRADWRRAGTGVHDDYLTKSRGNFRHKSLRRDSGMTVETPQGIRREKEMRIQQGRWSYNPSQATASSQSGSTSTTREPPRGPRCHNNPYGLTQPQSRRGDVPPLKELQGGYQRAASPARPTGATSNSESLQRTALPQNPEPVQKPATAPGPTAPDPSIPGPAATEAPSSQTPRRNFSMACKIEVMELCLASKDTYLNMTPSPSFDQKPFWNDVFQNIELNQATQGKFKDWKDLRYHVDVWVQPRRTSLRENNLPAPSVGQAELDRLIDEWNRVFAQRFCAINRGYFESNLWPLAEGHVMSIMQSEIQTWITGALERRMNELDRYTRRVLGNNRRPEDYDNPVRRLFYSSQATSQSDAAQVRETEALMSLVLDLQPQLRSAIADDIRNAGSNDHRDSNQSSSELQTTGQRQATGYYQHTQDEVVPSIETPTRTTGYRRAPGYYDQPVSSPPISPPMAGRSYDWYSRKRKEPEQSHSTPSTSNLSIRTRDLPGYGPGSGAKRRRVDGGMSEFPSPSRLMPRSSSPARARDTPDNPFETPQPLQRGQGTRRQESPNRFREQTAEFNNMTPDSRVDMLYKALKETRRENGKKR
ncbi:hypothetical protein MRS44_007008 [Fusarium solani]|uniref:Uncharacterized protein n=1 Tax=Fusarium solani TaxID=169388 RepID=A0A9P9RDE6_FUSSL|nr:uncharacterized protein B0J15DRAFT_587433 [Fusarium solani]KAH7274734.1 hypothetical protein B0J15DRAFT_587433 [Fusarium solani]KAJ3466350.1 hypothetical protein MRS44_007008 [Fusarium solani]